MQTIGSLYLKVDTPCDNNSNDKILKYMYTNHHALTQPKIIQDSWETSSGHKPAK